MEDVRASIRQGAVILTALITAVALGLDAIGVLSGVAWQWVALASFAVFVALVWWRVSELHTELDGLKGDQDFELLIRRLQERGEGLTSKATSRPTVDFVGQVVATKTWLTDCESELASRPELFSHFRGDGEPSIDVLGRWLEKWYGPTEVWTVNAVMDPKRLNEFIEGRIERLGEILFSMPGPASKVTRWG